MPIEINSDRAVCSKCGTSYSRYKGYFPVSYALLHKGIGHIPVCKSCIDQMYDRYLAQSDDPKMAVRQMCRKLDLFWSDKVFEVVSRKSTTKSMMTQYIAKINSITYAGKSYDDTLSKEGTLWSFGIKNDMEDSPAASGDGDEVISDSLYYGEGAIDSEEESNDEVPDNVRLYWGSGYTPAMYKELEDRRAFLLSKLPSNTELTIGMDTAIRQVCAMELDINKARAAGKNTDKAVTALNALLKNLPSGKKYEDSDEALSETPLGVWLYRYENKRPLPEVDDNLKDVNGLRKYVLTWVLGHLCKMLGLKNKYAKLYEDEISRLRVEHPEYEGDDDEAFLMDIMQDVDTSDRTTSADVTNALGINEDDSNEQV